MKNNILPLLLLCVMPCAIQAQTTAGFEEFSLPADSFYDGSDQSGGFTSGNLHFSNTYHAAWMFWESGWAYSNKTDSSQEGIAALYTSRAGRGYQSATYAIGQLNAVVRINAPDKGKQLRGAYFTNISYTYFSMLKGDNFAKKFGGSSGNDPDFFVLTIRAWNNGSLSTDSINFYLADYRNSNNNQDYIIKDWTWVDMSSLGNADSILFTMESSDTSGGWTNTPLFFAMDDLTVESFGTGISNPGFSKVNVYPNPSNGKLNIALPAEGLSLKLYDMKGNLIVKTEGSNLIDLTTCSQGAYILLINHNGVMYREMIYRQ